MDEILSNTPDADMVAILRSRDLELPEFHAMQLRIAARLENMRADLDQWPKWGVIEVAIRNPSVAEFMRHWEGRAKRAEGEVGQNFDEWQAEKKRADVAEAKVAIHEKTIQRLIRDYNDAIDERNAARAAIAKATFPY